MFVRQAAQQDAGAIGHVQVVTWQAAYADFMPASFLGRLDIYEQVQMWAQALRESRPGMTLVVE